MSVSLYTVEIPATHAGDQTVSSLYDWWFYAELGCMLGPHARQVRGSNRSPKHDRKLTSSYVSEAIQHCGRLDWAHALHSYVAMHEWKMVVGHYAPAWTPISPLVHSPLHELVHRTVGCESGISDEHLLKLVTREEQGIVGYTRANPFRKPYAKTR